MLTNVVYIEMLIDGEWKSYDTALTDGFGDPFVLARLSFL